MRMQVSRRGPHDRLCPSPEPGSDSYISHAVPRSADFVPSISPEPLLHTRKSPEIPALASDNRDGQIQEASQTELRAPGVADEPAEQRPQSQPVPVRKAEAITGSETGASGVLRRFSSHMSSLINGGSWSSPRSTAEMLPPPGDVPPMMLLEPQAPSAAEHAEQAEQKLDLDANQPGGESLAKQLRHLGRDTDTVLLKRTQLAQEQQKLVDCRKFMHESTEELVSVLRAREASEVSLTPGLRPDARLATPQTDRMSSSPSTRVDSGMAAPRSSIGAETTACAPDLGTLFGRWNQDYEQLSKQEGVIKVAADELDGLQYRLSGRTKAVSKILHSTTLAADLRTWMFHADAITLSSDSHAETESDVPPLIARWFDAQGDIGVYNERLAECEYTHQEGEEAREILRDRDETLEVSDEDFEANFERKRQEILRDLTNAENEARAVADLCREAGLNIEQYRVKNRSRFARRESIGSAEDAFDPDPFLRNEESYDNLDTLPGKGPARRIDNWLIDAQPEAGTAEDEQTTSSL